MISTSAEYALRAVVAIAQSNGIAVITSTIALKTKVPPGYLPKVLQLLRRGNIVEAKRGLGGGFTLARPVGEISLLDVVNAVDPIKRIERCPLGLAAHGTNLCALHRRLDQAAEALQTSFRETTIEELFGVAGLNEPLCQFDSPGRGLPITKRTARATDKRTRSRPSGRKLI